MLEGADLLMVETSSQRTYYAWGWSNVVAEYVETGSGTAPNYNKSYIYAGSRLLMTTTKASSTTETKEFHHPDRLGTSLVTNGGTGTSYRQSTLPFGTALGAESAGYRNQVFTSYDRSGSTGLDYAVNRSYSQGQSRFTQVDPLGMGVASVGNPQSNNLYAYTQNMPTDFVDPSGLLYAWFGGALFDCQAGCVGRADGSWDCVWTCSCVGFCGGGGGDPGGSGGPSNPPGGGGGGGGQTPAPVQPTCVEPPSILGAVNDGIGGAGRGMTQGGGTLGRTGYYANNWGGNQNVTTFGLAKAGSKLATASGWVNAIQATADIGFNLYSEGGVGPRTVRAGGRAAGSWAGSAGGAFVGAGAGFIVGGPLGAVIGGLVGSAAGGAAGSHVGNEVVHGIQDRNLPRGGRRSCP